jgi:hypothetical protein
VDTNIKERVVSAIQRDRLAEFIKSAYEDDKGACFYYSKIGAFDYLYRSETVPKKLEPIRV